MCPGSVHNLWGWGAARGVWGARGGGWGRVKGVEDLAWVDHQQFGGYYKNKF